MEIELSLLIPPPSPADRAKWQLAIDAASMVADHNFLVHEYRKQGRNDIADLLQKQMDMIWHLQAALNNTLEWVEYANRAFENQNKILELDNVRNPWTPKQ
jgi:hypothetical protein